MSKFVLFLFLFSLEVFADIKLPNPHIKVDDKVVAESKGNYLERRRLAAQFIRDYHTAYKHEFDELYPKLANPLVDDSSTKLFIKFTLEEATEKDLDRPLSELQKKIKREFDKQAMRPIMESMTIEDLKMYVIEHELKFQNLSDGILVPSVTSISEVRVSNQEGAKSDLNSILVLNNPLYTKYAILASFILSVINIMIFLLKKK